MYKKLYDAFLKIKDLQDAVVDGNEEAFSISETNKCELQHDFDENGVFLTKSQFEIFLSFLMFFKIAH